MNIDWNDLDKNTKRYLFGDLLDIPHEQNTIGWNIEYYSILIKYTNKSVLKKKHQSDLNWWLDKKIKNDRVKKLLQQHKER